MQPVPVPDPKDLLYGWKQIASYIGKTERTAMRWHEELNLPIHREKSSRIFAFKSEIDAWRAQHVDIGIGQPRSLIEQPLESAPKVSASQRSLLLLGWIVPVLLATLLFVTAYRSRDLSEQTSSEIKHEFERILWNGLTENSHSTRISLNNRSLDTVAAAPAGNVIWLFKNQDQRIVRLNLLSQKTEDFRFGVPIATVLPDSDGKRLYVGSTAGLSIFIPETGEITRLLSVPLVSSIALDNKRNKVYAACHWNGLAEIDLATRQIKWISRRGFVSFVQVNSEMGIIITSYQGGGPGGRQGHDVVEIFDSTSGELIKTISGPPIVGGPAILAKPSGSIWLDFWDACATATYDQVGCPAKNVRGYHVFEPPDYRLRQTIVGRLGPVRAQVCGEDCMIAGFTNHLDVYGGSTLSLKERWISPSFILSFVFQTETGRTIVLREGEIEVLRSLPVQCGKTALTTVSKFSFDGSLNDSVSVDYFEGSGGYEFAPGRLGGSLRLDIGANARLTSGSAWRFGDFQTQLATLSFYFRPRQPVTLFERRNASGGFELTWNQNTLALNVGGNVSISTNAESMQWHWIVVTRNRNQISLYLDGKLVGERIVTDWPKLWREPYFLNGPIDIDELKMYSGAMDAAGVEADWSLQQSQLCRP